MKSGCSNYLRKLGDARSRLAAAWRHPFNSKKRKAYRKHCEMERENADVTVQDRIGSASWLRALLTSPRSLATHARLYERYVSNAQSRYGRTDYVEETRTPLRPGRSDVKLIAYYLPQFHPTEENDRWWGKGFTEWRNVARAYPSFENHYQPRLPGELGYYDLRVVDVMRRQVELARQYGISAFCFHFYWFGGKRLLELPILNYLENKDLDLPFCLCWANENWSRTWDGLANQVLISQNHSDEDDLAFIRYLDRYFRDERYLKIDGRPVLTLYRPALLVDAAATVVRWRDAARALGYPGLYLIATNSFEFSDFRSFGFDALSEFPPHGIQVPNIENHLDVSKFRTGGGVRFYPSLVEDQLAKAGVRGVHPGVMPSWDNSARRPAHGTVFHGATPELFRDWLKHALERAEANPPNERMVFINAWNEWAEGAYLEPDARYGYAWLQAVSDALNSAAQARRILLVSHDAHPYGAQLLVLNIARTLSKLHFQTDLIVLGQGPLLPRFREVAKVHAVDLDSEAQGDVTARLRALRRGGVAAAVVNSAASGRIVPLLKEAGFEVATLVHELPGVLSSYKLEESAAAIASQADKVIFPAEIVRQKFEVFAGSAPKVALVRPQGLYLRPDREVAVESGGARERICQSLGLAAHSKLILSVAKGDWRKGFDLFVDAAIHALARDPLAAAVWVGDFDKQLLKSEMAKIAAAGLADRFIFTGLVPDPRDFYRAGDVFVLSSREDPFPSVILEALAAGLPVIAFAGATGGEELLKRGCGRLVPAFDTEAMADAICALLEEPETARKLGKAGRDIVETEFNFRDYVFDLVSFAGQPLPRVSVVVPNYNYARYLAARLASIADQTIPVFELILLDDASTDESVDAIRSFLSTCDIRSKLVINDINCGSAFRQWKCGVERARGDYIWIAEADDLADPDFLAEVLPAFDDPDVVISFCQSQQIDEAGRVISKDYLNYVSDIDRMRWRTKYTASGREEIRAGLAIKNTIPNVSGAVFRRQALASVLSDYIEQIASLRHAGDWMAYVRLLEHGSIAFSPNALNKHRRHGSSITTGEVSQRHVQEIAQVQDYIVERFGLGPEARAGAREYLERLQKQFGLGEIARSA